jgi:hypothetical protein
MIAKFTSRGFSLLLGLASATALQAETAGAFFKDAKAGAVVRAATFHRYSQTDGPAATFNQDGAGFGGWVFGNTGELGETLSFGGAYYFVTPLHSPKGRSFNYILKDPDQDGFGILGEANVKLRYDKHSLTVGRQSLNFAWYMDDVYRFYNKLDQSMVGRRDVRGMHPITYEAAVVRGSLVNDTVRYYAGQATKMKQINDDEFRNLYKGAYQTTVFPESAKRGDSDGMDFVGAIWKPNKNLMLTGSYHAVDDMLNMAYVDLDYVHRLTDKRYVRFGTQFMYQSSNGDSQVSNGRSFDTQYGGVYGEVRLVPWLIGYGMGGLTADGEEIRAPYSIGPSYLIQRVGENSKAGERTWILGSIIDFSSLGARGLSFDINYGQRSNRHVAHESSKPLADWDELATDLVYFLPPEAGFFSNLRLRARWARVWEKGEDWSGGVQGRLDQTRTDVRFDASLNIPFN